MYHGGVPHVHDPFAHGATLLDVRFPHEQAGGMLPGAVSAPLPDLPGRVHQIFGPLGPGAEVLDRPVMVYCRLGRRAEAAVRYLRSIGFRRVCNIGGTDVDPLRAIFRACSAPITSRGWAEHGERHFMICRSRWLASQRTDGRALLGMYRHAYGAELNWLDAGAKAAAERWGQVREAVASELVGRISA